MISISNVGTLKFEYMEDYLNLSEWVRIHRDLKVESSHAKIYENFSNYFLKAYQLKTYDLQFYNVNVQGYTKAQVSQSDKIKAQGIVTLQSRPCLKN